MKNKDINLGYIHMSSYNYNGRLFPDWYYENDGSNTEEEFAEFQREVKDLPPNEIIVAPNESMKLEIDYPLTNSFMTSLIKRKSGWTRRQIVEFIIKCYKKIYQVEESKLNKHETGNIPGMYNRKTTNGEYGIWGHEMGDLILHTLSGNDGCYTVVCDS